GLGKLDKITTKKATHRGVSLLYGGGADERKTPETEDLGEFDKFSKGDFELLDEMLAAVKRKYGGDQSLPY
ncbi:MAG: hypothetical protein JSV39_00695, partial [Candidatus Aenigmatarchaeota archaeon]